MRLVCVAICALAAGAPPVHAQSPAIPLRLTESDALARQRAADPAIRAIEARAAAVRAANAERTLWPNPVASLSRESVADTSDLFVVGRQELPISGRRGHLREAGRLAGEAADAEAAFDVSARQAALRRAFVALVAAQQRQATLARSVADLRGLVDVLRAREDAGEGSRYDRLRGERALADLENDLAAADLARARARVDLAGYLGPDVAPESLEAGGTLELPAPPPLAALIAQALDSRADYRSAALDAARIDRERQAARALRLPVPSLGVGLKRSGTEAASHTGHLLSLDVAVPLFNRGQAAVALAAAEAARVTLARAALGALVESEVRSAHLTLSMELDRARRYRQAVAETAEPLTDIARVAYEDGELGILELLDAHRQLTEARLEVLRLSAASRLAGIELDRVTGVEVRP